MSTGLAVQPTPAQQGDGVPEQGASRWLRSLLGGRAWIAVAVLAWLTSRATSIGLLDTLAGVVLVVALTAGYFVEANAFAGLAYRRFGLFAALGGALLGALVGLVANSGGWFPGEPWTWSLGGAVLGVVVGLGVDRLAPPPPDRRWRISERLRPAIFVSPALLFVGVTLVVPTLRTIYLSFRDRRGEEGVGFRNYRSIRDDSRIFNLDGFGDLITSQLFVAGVVVAVVGVGMMLLRSSTTGRGIDFSAPLPTVSLTGGAALVLLGAVGALRGVLWNNLFWVVFVTGFSTVLGLAVAVLADRSRGESLAKSLIFMPMAISFVGASVIWRFVYAWVPGNRDQIGLLNALWVAGGGEPQTWIQEQPWNTLFLIVIMIWIQTGFAMVILSAAIKGVPEEMREAARVDGAGEASTFWRVVLPQIRSTIIVVVTTLIITVLKIYDIVKVMTNGEFGTNVVANQMFDEVFINLDNGRGSALAALLFVAVLPLMVVNMLRVRKEGA